MNSNNRDKSVSSGNILIEQNLTQIQKLVIYLGFIGVLFLRSLSFYYQEQDFANPDHPEHKYYQEVIFKKRANLAAAILVFMWYFYNLVFIEPFYRKYVTERSRLRVNDNLTSSSSQAASAADSEPPASETRAPYEKVTRKRESFQILDLKNPEVPVNVETFNGEIVSYRPHFEHLVLPKKMPLKEYMEWKIGEIACTETTERKEPKDWTMFGFPEKYPGLRSFFNS